jgi:GNAT superfamily N-acetyltransferase
MGEWMNDVKTRLACETDVQTLRVLMGELGHSLSIDIVDDRLKLYTGTPTTRLIVAERQGVVVGLVTCTLVPMFHEVGNLGRITALVVSSEARRQKVGEMLVTAAKEWFRSNGCRRIEVTSGDARTDAHLFYEALGFAPVSRRFIAHLP